MSDTNLIFDQKKKKDKSYNTFTRSKNHSQGVRILRQVKEESIAFKL